MGELADQVTNDLEVPRIGAILLHLACAVVLGAFIAYRPWRRLMGLPPPPREIVHTQILLCLAGAIAVTMIGKSLARAFGLVGLGGFIRFRTGIRDPRDAAVFFLVIGIGMACGIGIIGVAVVCAVFVAIALAVLDGMRPPKGRPYIRVRAIVKDPLGAARPMREAIEKALLIVRHSSVKLDDRELRFDLENSTDLDMAQLEAMILDAARDLIVELECESLETLKG